MSHPRLEDLLEVLKPKMQPYRSQRATRSEFKALTQNENEDLREFSRRVRSLGDIAFSDKPLHERERESRDQFLEGLSDSRLRQKLYEDERERNFYETVERAQELELIQKLAESRRDRRPAKIHSSYEESEPLEKVRASYSDKTRFDEQFAALQTSMNNIASRFDRLEATICQQSAEQTERLEKLRSEFMQGIKEMTAAIVGAVENSQNYCGGQFEQWHPPQSQKPPTPNSQTKVNTTGSSGQLNQTPPPPPAVECFKCKNPGHFVKQCPHRSAQNHLNWKQPSAQ